MWTLDSDQPVPFWRPDAPDPATCLAFSTRRGGVSAPPFDTLNLGRSTEDRPAAIEENRRRFLTTCHLSPDRAATAGQVHGSRVVEVTQPGHHPDCDALLTRVPGLALCITMADCLPLLYVAPGAVAAAHSGWRGTAGGMPRLTLAAVCAAVGVAPGAVRVHLGPCIRSCCYEVGAEVARRFPSGAVTRVEGSWRLDLPTAARLQLLESGVPLASISDVRACTSCEPHWYFSHRRDAGRTGRHWAIAARLTG